ncbi:YisL family protein [Ornithinibacillus halophilus]|uniref:UPF0344 protein SAMN05216225_102115 n=1 Tax=Ornithinibacillus halophilus TaxID=930117 RepID=A0A1M5I2T4_9BACI|nr:YisL family protein [Ornithinibacillus halophilus]SHG22359.1 Protein of unknown function [Ornithinibacillus halophilus]
MNTHLHITSWVLAFVLFAVAVILHKKGNAKAGKIVQMILRLDYLLILYSGGHLLGGYLGNATGGTLGEVIVKGIAGIWVIAAMEMIAVKTAKDKPTKGWWIQFVIAVLLTLILGFMRLGYGVLI